MTATIEPRDGTRIVRIGVFSALAGRTARRPAASRRSRSQPAPAELSRRVRHPRPHRQPWCGAAGSNAAPAPTSVAAATSSCRCPGTGCSICSPPSWRACATRTGRRDLRRLLWLVQRRAFPSRAEPGAPFPEQRARRLCALGQQLQRRRVGGDPAAYPGRLRGASRGATSPGSRSPTHTDDRGRLRRHGDEEHRMVAAGGISRHVERDAMRRAQQRGTRVRAGQPAARRSAGGGRRRMDADASPAPTRR